MNDIHKTIKYTGRTALAGFVMLWLGSCDGLLSVNDPGAIQQHDLEDPGMEQLLMNGVLSEFQYTYNYMTLTASILSDELYTDHTNIDHREFALFNFSNTNALNNNTYVFLQKARVIAEDTAERIRDYHGGTANLNVAEALAYAGYAYTLLGEHFCEAPIGRSAAFSSNELLAMGIERFDEAIQLSSGLAQQNPDRANHIVNLARVGAARASLQMGSTQQAVTYASQVADGFEAWIYRSSNSGREQSIIGVQWATTGQWLSADPRFQHLDDPRVRHTEEARLGLNAREIYVPYRPFMFHGWDRNDPEQIVDLSTHIRFASSLEARYIIAEAQGPTEATLQFVNERRQFADQDPVSLSGDALMGELREQRARDFFMAVQRHGDLRRYLNLYGIDLFPSGNYPVTTEPYGNARCFIIPLSEISANPNL